MPSYLVLRVALFAIIATAALPAQKPKVGSPAPPVVATSWLNWEGEAPTLQSLAGRVVLLEFWGTWCGPCVRAMPGIQKLHDRYSDRGLTVLAISYETPASMKPFLAKNAYTMPVGSDPDKKTISAYSLRGWPTTIVIDKEGKIAHIGSPYDAEAAVEKALGLEAGPAALLDLYLESREKPGKETQRSALARLAEKAPTDFDLQSWAKGHLTPDTVVSEGEPTPEPAKRARKLGNPAKVLGKCVHAWSSEAKRQPLLQQLGDAGPRTFDLAAFAQGAFAKAYPFVTRELKTLLKEKKYGAVLEAIAQRAPASAVLATAAKHKGLASYCQSKVNDAHTMAKKGLMAQLWVFPGALPHDQDLNSKFFGELSISGMATSKDKKSIIGLTLGGTMVMSDAIDAYVEGHLSSAALMEDLGAGKKPNVRQLGSRMAKNRKAIIRKLEGSYGKPKPRGK